MERIARAYGIEGGARRGPAGTGRARRRRARHAGGARLRRISTRPATGSTARPPSPTWQHHAERGAIDPEEGLRRLDEIAALPHRFGAPGVIGGHMVLTIGLALILQPTPQGARQAAVVRRADRLG